MSRLRSCLSCLHSVQVMFVVMAIVLVAAPASAGPIVYQQPAQSPVASTRASQDQTGGSGIEFQTWDNFLLATDTLIDGVDWQGSYFNTFVTSTAFAPPANATGFVVGFYSNAAGAPGSLLASQTFTPAGANQTFVGQQAFNTLGLSIYNYSSPLSNPFLAVGGVTYWLSVYALSPLASPTEAQWGWNGGTGGNGTAFQSGTGAVNFDRALAIHGTPVPEPTTMILFGSGIAAVAARARARRRTRR